MHLKPKRLTLAIALAAAPWLLVGCGGGSSAIATSPSTTIPTPQLAARAVLAAASFADGPASGQYLGGSVFNGQSAPFAKQPIKAFRRF
jgi:glycerophosphoryl diester phosphodiesterase